MDTCEVVDCGRPRRARDWCNRHYENWRLTGAPVPYKDLPLRTRLSDVGWDVTEEGCWEWRGRRNEHGYGLLNHQRVHRLVYALEHPEDPPSAQVRHLCDNPPCVNPEHLLGGTALDNARDMVDRRRHWAHSRTHCAAGHDLTLDGATREYVDGSRCVACRRERSLRYNGPVGMRTR